MKIAIGSDHGGYLLKEEIKAHLTGAGHEVMDEGCHGMESCDYPVFGKKVAELVSSGDAERGIVICTTGIGISIAANKVEGIRAALCTNTLMARLCREHNDANVLSLGAGITGPLLAKDIVDTFLGTDFSGGERHRRRVSML